MLHTHYKRTHLLEKEKEKKKKRVLVKYTYRSNLNILNCDFFDFTNHLFPAICKVPTCMHIDFNIYQPATPPPFIYT